MRHPSIRTKGEALAAGKGWLEVRCDCKTVFMPFRLMPPWPDDMLLTEIAARHRCRTCGKNGACQGAWSEADAQGRPSRYGSAS